MSISSELTRITQAKDEIITAIKTAGGTVSEGAVLDDLPEIIEALGGGGGDYDSVFHAMIDENDSTLAQSIELPDDVTHIRASSLRALRALSVIGQAVQSLGEEAFCSNAVIQSVSMPACTSLGYSAICDMSCLETVSMPLLQSSQGKNFVSCSSLREVSLPVLSTVGEADFFECTVLQKIVIPRAMSFTYSLCSLPNLINLSLPAATSLSCALCDNTNLQNLFLPGWTVCSQTDSLQNTPIASGSGTIWVNSNMVSSYIYNPDWSAYASQIKAISEYTGDFDYNEGV